MRNLEFRVWRYCHREKRFKYYYLNNLRIIRNGGADITFQADDLGYFDGAVDHVHGEEVIEQFTGLTDKNGKKIFEGDILKVEWERKGNFVIEEIRFGSGAFYLHHYDFLCCGVKHPNTYPDGEVIGNIHENPELLK